MVFFCCYEKGSHLCPVLEIRIGAAPFLHSVVNNLVAKMLLNVWQTMILLEIILCPLAPKSLPSLIFFHIFSMGVGVIHGIFMHYWCFDRLPWSLLQ